MEYCKKKGIFYPELLFNDLYELTPEFLQSKGIKGLLLDLDNTVAPYEVAQPDERMNAWYTSMCEQGIRLAFVSNNHGERVSRFNRHWRIPQFCNAGKPSPKGMKRALAECGLKPEETAALGDQIFTDCIAAHRAGMVFFLVPPIRDKQSLLFRCKRFLERPIVRCFRSYPKTLSVANIR